MPSLVEVIEDECGAEMPHRGGMNQNLGKESQGKKHVFSNNSIVRTSIR